MAGRSRGRGSADRRGGEWDPSPRSLRGGIEAGCGTGHHESVSLDNIDHVTLLSILREKVHDNRFLILIEDLLKAGYLEQWAYQPTLSGTPQGGIISPLLANIYLDRLDRYVEQTLIPGFTRGNQKRPRPEYRRLRERIGRLERNGDIENIDGLYDQLRAMPIRDGFDPNYRRLRYARYADDCAPGHVCSR